jgi:hypothetical protein
MPTPATDRQRITLITIAIASVVAAALAFRAVNAAAGVVEKPVPAVNLQGLSAFLGPLPDSSRLAEVGAGSMVGDRDPFGSTMPVTRAPVVIKGDQASRPKPGRSQQWVVSSILFEDTKRSAIVNNTWVGVGDPLGGGARVTAIERKYVIVTDANGTRHVVPIQGGA